MLLLIEYGIIVTRVTWATTSHFDFFTPVDATLFEIMGFSIAALWTATLALTGLLPRTPIADPADRWAPRLGAVSSLVGIDLGALMTRPAQIASMRDGTFEGIVGVHSVGVPDRGDGMPVTRWSMTGAPHGSRVSSESRHCGRCRCR